MFSLIDTAGNEALMRRLLIDMLEDADEMIHRKTGSMSQFIQRNAEVETLVDQRTCKADAVDIGMEIRDAS